MVPALNRIVERNGPEPVGLVAIATLPVHLRFPEGSLSLGKPSGALHGDPRVWVWKEILVFL